MVSGFTLLLQAQTLRQVADQDGLLVGTAVRSTPLSEPTYASTLAREFNMVEAEAAMKWWVLRPDVSTYDFRKADDVAVSLIVSHFANWFALRKSIK
ncbi:MAG: endo-1,4-beta-xylanase [Candidatus Sulfotelmatobacter sp.]|jgi:GH35 family endo-1,4-beta-xylanase